MYKLPDLVYDYTALGEYISRDIMMLHHDKHHQGYVDKFNAALDQAPELKERSLDDLLTGINELPESVRTAIRNNGGGHY
ncbi:MAG TPA: superoxide dismutase, partial [Candidatus Saccharibacteria bacterium]|nr:superoxide dismutase [Candidatus Saccharibacteria bacterium]